MDRVRLEVADSRDGLPQIADEPDLVVELASESSDGPTHDDHHISRLRLQIAHEPGQRVDDTVGLRMRRAVMMSRCIAANGHD